MECVVCYDGIERVRRTRACANPACRGRSVVCASCDAKLARCVYCHENLRALPRRTPATDPSGVMIQMYVALYYASLLGYLTGQCDGEELFLEPPGPAGPTGTTGTNAPTGPTGPTGPTEDSESDPQSDSSYESAYESAYESESEPESETCSES